METIGSYVLVYFLITIALGELNIDYGNFGNIDEHILQVEAIILAGLFFALPYIVQISKDETRSVYRGFAYKVYAISISLIILSIGATSTYFLTPDTSKPYVAVWAVRIFVAATLAVIALAGLMILSIGNPEEKVKKRK